MVGLTMQMQQDDPAFHHSESSQDARILEYLKEGHSLTPLDALKRFNCFRLGARMYDLKREGWKVCSEIVRGENGKHWARYWIEK